MKSPQQHNQKESFLMYKEYNIDQLVLPLDVEVFVPKKSPLSVARIDY